MKDIFLMRSEIIREIRNFLHSRGFVEVETPMMQAIPGGAAAQPFKTHHNALGCDFYLRIAMELYLKRLLVGGVDKVFEIGRNFRNEGLSRKHNPEFTMLEAYQAFGDYESMMELVQGMVCHVAQKVLGTLVVEHGQLDVGRSMLNVECSQNEKTFNAQHSTSNASAFAAGSGRCCRATRARGRAISPLPSAAPVAATARSMSPNGSPLG